MKPTSNYLLWFILFLLHLTFFLYGHFCGNIFLKDSVEYLTQAGNILKHGTWYCGNLEEPILPQLYSQRPPLYGVFIMLLNLMVHSTFFISIVQSLLSIINIFLALQLIKTSNPKRFNPFLFLLPFLFFPSQFIYANMLMPEMLLQTMVMLSVYFLLDYYQNKKITAFLFYQLSITAALLVKPVFFLFPFISLVLFLIMERKNSSKMLTASFHLIPLAVIIFVSFINYECTGYFEYSSTPRKLMINYGARYSVAYNEGDTISLQQIDSIEVHAATLLTYPQKARFIKSGAMTMIRQNAGAFILLTTKGIFNFFTDHSRYDIESFTGDIPKENQRGWRERYQKEGLYGVSNYFSSLNPFYYAYLLISMIINLLLLFGLFRFAFRKEIPLYCRLTFLSFIFYVALLSGMTGTTRFRLPVFLLIVVVNMVALGQKKYFSQNKEQVV